MHTHEPVRRLQLQKAIDTTLADFFQRGIETASLISPHYEQLWRYMQHVVMSGGKRIRPRLVIETYQAFGGTNQSGILPIAASQELLHQSLLVHDDIIDRDIMRHGNLNVQGIFEVDYLPLIPDETERTHFARSAALLAGDLLLSGAYELCLSASLPPETIIEAQALLSRSIVEVAGGELLDTEATFRLDGTISAEVVSHFKTASYSFIGPMVIGAVLAGATPADQLYLRQFATHLGIAYQMVDDLLGVFGNETVTGKSVLSDLREGKRTSLIDLFDECAFQEQKDLFYERFGTKTLTEKEANELRVLLDQSGAKQRAETLIEERRVFAITASHALSEAVRDKQYFIRLSDQVLKRDQ